ncbi:kinase-like protein [Calocera viscosa TUFC12733]|uniref:Kinase-like protein n=1 Tax=Calocera viscosa (strain TUFC12733) TaxID=1330018 RepID=A0A167PQV2_CALVF|nr:kinase-like protein [Calocera viscosa TUFC12733]
MALGLKNLNPYITDISQSVDVIGGSSYIRTARFRDRKVALKARRLADGGHRRLERWAWRPMMEVIIWQRLKHPNILELDGIYENMDLEESSSLTLVSPWMDHGNIEDYLLQYPGANRLQLVRDITLGLSYLHESLDVPVVHGNLRASNVLINSNGRACLAGFSLTRFHGNGQTGDWSDDDTGILLGHIRWMAPERLDPERYGMTLHTSNTTATDIYAFGMVIYEIYTGQQPFYHVPNDYAAIRLVLAGDRPVYPDQDSAGKEFSDTMWDMARDCWRDAREDRPAAKELVRRVAALIVDDVPTIAEDEPTVAEDGPTIVENTVVVVEGVLNAPQVAPT